MKTILIITIIAVVAIAIFAANKSLTGNAIETSNSKEITQERNTVKIPLSELSTDAKWYTYKSGTKNIEYFAVKDSNGEVKVAFDACDVCYKAGKGYRQQGKDMICNNCGNYYPISGIGTKNLKGGGCWPGYLPSKIEGDYLVLNKPDLEAGKYRF